MLSYDNDRLTSTDTTTYDGQAIATLRCSTGGHLFALDFTPCTRPKESMFDHILHRGVLRIFFNFQARDIRSTAERQGYLLFVHALALKTDGGETFKRLFFLFLSPKSLFITPFLSYCKCIVRKTHGKRTGDD